MDQGYRNVVTLEQWQNDPAQQERVSRLTRIFLPHLEDGRVQQTCTQYTPKEQPETQS